MLQVTMKEEGEGGGGGEGEGGSEGEGGEGWSDKSLVLSFHFIPFVMILWAKA